MLASVDGALHTHGDGAIPAWERICDETWIARLSNGEQALVELGLQLYNGTHIPVDRPPSLFHALCALDRPGRDRFIGALLLMEHAAQASR
jgi:hypothetical protein